jgi:GntR family transcriptional regulator of arabinose operon
MINGGYPGMGIPAWRNDMGRRAGGADFLLSRGHRKIGGIYKSDGIKGHMRYAGLRGTEGI